MQVTQPAFFKQGPKPLTRVLVFSVLSIALMVGDTQYKLLGKVREHLSVLLYPLQWMATTPVNAVLESSAFLEKQATLISENKRLQDAQLLAAAQAMRLKQLERENAQLRRLEEASSVAARHTVLTQVLYNGRDPFAARLIVDKGERNGVKSGQIALDASGVVGQIVRTQPLTSEVRLISDRNHMVPVMVARNSLRTVVYGTGSQGLLEVRNMAPNVDIQQGDELVTSGLDGVYPAGLPVARVVKVERNASSAFARIFCAPIALIDQHRYLLLLDPPVMPAPNPDQPQSAKGQ